MTFLRVRHFVLADRTESASGVIRWSVDALHFPKSPCIGRVGPSPILMALQSLLFQISCVSVWAAVKVGWLKFKAGHPNTSQRNKNESGQQAVVGEEEAKSLRIFKPHVVLLCSNGTPIAPFSNQLRKCLSSCEGWVAQVQSWSPVPPILTCMSLAKSFHKKKKPSCFRDATSSESFRSLKDWDKRRHCCKDELFWLVRHFIQVGACSNFLKVGF